jgi:hypothetical protein
MVTVASHFKRNKSAPSQSERREAASARAAHETSNPGRGTAPRNRRQWPLAQAPSPSQSKDRTSRAWGRRWAQGGEQPGLAAARVSKPTVAQYTLSWPVSIIGTESYARYLSLCFYCRYTQAIKVLNGIPMLLRLD